MSSEIRIRDLHAMNDLLATVELQRAVWGMEDHECTSPHTMKAATVSGGGVLGAEADGQLIGFCFGIAAKRGAEVWLWSHMAAVHPDFQGRGIGFALKQAQRQWALGQGYRIMAWTFDPLQSGNANFNFNKLGATARRYYVNHYGAMADGINAGLASDRLEAQWRLDDARVLALADGNDDPKASIECAEKLVYIDADGEIRQIQPASRQSPVYAVEIPGSIAELKQRDMPLAKAWQLHIRRAIQDLLDTGYIVSGFARDSGRCFYVLTRR